MIATKGGLRISDGELRRDSSPEWLREGMDQSLRELGTDHVDLYQLHWPDLETPFEETAGALEELVQQGKTRYVGVSNFAPQQMAALQHTRRIDTLQPPYHIFRREIEREILPYCREHGIGVLVYGPLAHGLLTGKIDEQTEFAEGDWRRGSDVFRGEEFVRNLSIVRELDRYASQRGWTVAQLAIAWALSTPGVDAAIVGARNPGQIEGTAPAGDIDFSARDRQEVDEIIEGAVPWGPLSGDGLALWSFTNRPIFSSRSFPAAVHRPAAISSSRPARTLTRLAPRATSRRSPSWTRRRATPRRRCSSRTASR